MEIMRRTKSTREKTSQSMGLFLESPESISGPKS